MPQIRILHNVCGLAVLCVLALWCVRDRLWEHAPGISVGVAAGAGGGWLWWRHLSRRITRRDRRYERNKIFVHYLSLLEVGLAAVAYNPFLVLPLVRLCLFAVQSSRKAAATEGYNLK